MTKRGWFLSFEGLDGSGKTTQMHRFAARLRVAGFEVIQTVEPGGTEIGRAIRQILLDPANQHLSPVAELLLYFAARAQNVDECIRPALETGRIVLADRYTDSTLAYQGAGRNLGWEVVQQLHAIACRGVAPELTFYIDIDAETSIERALARNKVKSGPAESRLDDESAEFHSRVRDAYERIAREHPGRIRRIDGRGPVEEVEERIWSTFEEWRVSHV